YASISLGNISLLAVRTVFIFIKTSLRMIYSLYNKCIEYFILSRDSFSIKKILVAVDGSKTSLDAAEHAVCQAEKHHSELTVQYVVSSDVRYGYLEDDQRITFTGPLKEIVTMAVERG